MGKISVYRQKYRYSIILLKELVLTDFKIRYQGSVLGYLWSLLRPLFLFAILYVVFVYFLKIGADIPNWPVALLLGIVLWNFFAELTNQGLKAVVSASGLMRKLSFPKYVTIAATSTSAFINLLFNLTIVAVLIVVNRIDLTWTALLLPVYIFEILAFGVGLSFILSTLYVKYRDFSFVWEIIMQGLFYGSAILYPVSRIMDLGQNFAILLLMNPVAQAIQDARHVLLNDKIMTLSTITDSMLLIALPFLIVLVGLVFGAWLFKRRSPYFAEEA